VLHVDHPAPTTSRLAVCVCAVVLSTTVNTRQYTMESHFNPPRSDAPSLTETSPGLKRPRGGKSKGGHPLPQVQPRSRVNRPDSPAEPLTEAGAKQPKGKRNPMARPRPRPRPKPKPKPKLKTKTRTLRKQQTDAQPKHKKRRTELQLLLEDQEGWWFTRTGPSTPVVVATAEMTLDGESPAGQALAHGHTLTEQVVAQQEGPNATAPTEIEPPDGENDSKARLMVEISGDSAEPVSSPADGVTESRPAGGTTEGITGAGGIEGKPEDGAKRESRWSDSDSTRRNDAPRAAVVKEKEPPTESPAETAGEGESGSPPPVSTIAAATKTTLPSAPTSGKTEQPGPDSQGDAAGETESSAPQTTGSGRPISPTPTPVLSPSSPKKVSHSLLVPPSRQVSSGPASPRCPNAPEPLPLHAPDAVQNQHRIHSPSSSTTRKVHFNAVHFPPPRSASALSSWSVTSALRNDVSPISPRTVVAPRPPYVDVPSVRMDRLPPGPATGMEPPWPRWVDDAYMPTSPMGVGSAPTRTSSGDSISTDTSAGYDQSLRHLGGPAPQRIEFPPPRFPAAPATAEWAARGQMSAATDVDTASPQPRDGSPVNFERGPSPPIPMDVDPQPSPSLAPAGVRSNLTSPLASMNLQSGSLTHSPSPTTHPPLQLPSLQFLPPGPPPAWSQPAVDREAPDTSEQVIGVPGTNCFAIVNMRTGLTDRYIRYDPDGYEVVIGEDEVCEPGGLRVAVELRGMDDESLEDLFRSTDEDDESTILDAANLGAQPENHDENSQEVPLTTSGVDSNGKDRDIGEDHQGGDDAGPMAWIGSREDAWAWPPKGQR